MPGHPAGSVATRRRAADLSVDAAGEVAAGSPGGPAAEPQRTPEKGVWSDESAADVAPEHPIDDTPEHAVDDAARSIDAPRHPAH